MARKPAGPDAAAVAAVVDRLVALGGAARLDQNTLRAGSIHLSTARRDLAHGGGRAVEALAWLSEQVALLERRAQSGAPGPGEPGWPSWLASRRASWVAALPCRAFRPEIGWGVDLSDDPVGRTLEAPIAERFHRKREAQAALRDAVVDRVLAWEHRAPLPPVVAAGPEAAALLAEAEAAADGLLLPPRPTFRADVDAAAAVVRLASDVPTCGGALGVRLAFEGGALRATPTCTHRCGYRARALEGAVAFLATDAGRTFLAAGRATPWERAVGALEGMEAVGAHAVHLTRSEGVLRGVGIDAQGQRTPGADFPDPSGFWSAPDSYLGMLALQAADIVLDGAPVALRRVHPSIVLRRGPGGLLARLRVGRWEGAPDALAVTGPVRWAPEVDGEVAWFGVGEVTARLLDLASAPIPEAELPRVHAALIRAGVPCDLTEEVVAPMAWSGELRAALRFDPRQGLVGRIRVRLPDGTEAVPGEGALRRLLPGPPPRALVRDAVAERVAAETLLAALPVAREPDGAFVATSLEDAAATALALEAWPGVELVWEQPMRVARVDGEAVRLSWRGVGAWFELGGEVEGDGLSLAELLAAVRDRQRVVLAPGRLVVLAEELFTKYAALADAVDEGRSGLRVGKVHTGALREALAGLEGAAEPAADSPVPAGLRAELRGYQRDGYAFLARRAAWAPGAVLADDMGLGKTVQTIALLCARTGPALVIAPTSVCPKWAAELARFAPDLRVTVRSGGPRTAALAPGPGEVVVTSWDLLVRDEAALAAVEWDTVVFDEAQAAKNPRSRRAGAAGALAARFRVALTGTPIENRLSDLWSILAFTAPGLLPREDLFRARFQVPIERDRDADRLARLRGLVLPFLLRRTKAEVAPELPLRTELVERVALLPGERKAYDRLRTAAQEALAVARGTTDRIRVLAAITRLRQLACDLRLVEPEAREVGSKLGRLVELATEWAAAGEKVLVFSEFTSLLDLAESALADAGLAQLRLDGRTPAAARADRVARFQAGEAPIFLLSRKAGGTGIDLTAATAVVHLDPWWNPAAEDQATDRAHRIGQTRPVTVVRLLAADTLEERVHELQAEKRALVSGVLEGAGEGALDLAALRGLLDGAPGDDPVPGWLDDALEAARAHLARSVGALAPSSLVQYRSVLAAFEAWCAAQEAPPASLSAALAAYGRTHPVLTAMAKAEARRAR